ncbi:MAG: DUF975 family protein [Lachnospiraceae bacterium]|nr:DUF975 family protein [Lachnospiraceae bacterium]
MNRKEIKAKGKTAFKANYWPAVLAGFLLQIAVSAGSTATAQSGQDEVTELKSSLEGLDPAALALIVTTVLSAVIIVLAISSVLNIFVLRPLELGCQNFFRKNLEAPAPLGETCSGFKGNYGKNVVTMLLRDIFLALWTCLFIIPGIIKTYSYRFVPYIREEHPEMSATEVITESRRMMDGHKWEAFVFDLSFIGWFLLAAITCNLVGIFYVRPYYASSCANYYEAVKGTTPVSTVE